ncbi:hypothetical protein RclHR1_25160001 [Rhizophagus clarus]|uniref:Uncharacterized protein n=1 Tax=Rhizophagus clarus TaxID=94130 RepID=A0A2Z6RCN1_9GLOM|nr:hypothetical protein RclHR1_25160001 [Rhizophagus clarus]
MLTEGRLQDLDNGLELWNCKWVFGIVEINGITSTVSESCFVVCFSSLLFFASLSEIFQESLNFSETDIQVDAKLLDIKGILRNIDREVY